MDEFKRGKKLHLLNGKTITVQSKIGEGGQGAVYSVDYNGKKYALKWYLPNYLRGLKPNCKDFYKNLVRNVEDGTPSSQFLWMQAVAVTGKHNFLQISIFELSVINIATYFKKIYFSTLIPLDFFREIEYN